MEKINLSQLELNIKALEKIGIKVKDYSGGNSSTKGDLKVKDVDTTKGKVAFYHSAFNNEDSDGDVISPGAFTKTIKENFERFKHFKNHDATLAPGKVMTVEQDSHGAFTVSQMSKSTLGRDTLIEYQEEIITEHSMGFRVIKEERDQKSGVNFIKELMLWEVSSLTAWGANANTPVIAKEDKIDAKIKAIEKVLRTGNISDEGAQRLINDLEELIEMKKAKPDPMAELTKILKEGLLF